MSDLPESWSEVSIGTVCRVVSGGTPPSKDPANFTTPGAGIPWLTPADLSGYRGQTIERGKRDLTAAGLAACGATLLPKGAVLFSSRAPIGYVAIAANEISTNQGFKSFVLPEGFDSRYCYYQLKYLRPQAEMVATGTTFKELSGAVAATLPFKIAPLNEQTRIADQLDTLLARIQACNDRLDAIPALLKRFRRAVLSSAVRGQLTEDWRGDGRGQVKLQGDALWSVPEDWRWRAAGDECGFITKGTTPPKEKMHSAVGEVPYIKVYNLTFNGALDFTIDPTFVDARTHRGELKRSIALPGDVLMNIVGPPLGKVSVVPTTHPEWNINQAIARFRPGPNLRSDYLAACLLSPELVDYAVSKAKATAGQWNLTLEICRGLPIPIPSLEEQDEVVRRIHLAMRQVARIESHCAAAASHIQRLTPLTLAKAFRGELVQQDMNDEPASVLLARVAAKRRAPSPAIGGPAPRRGPPRAPKETIAMTKSRQDNDVMNQPYLSGHLRRIGMPASAESLFKLAELSVADFYKQLAWEVAQGHVKDNQTTLEPGNAAG